ncbi:MAG: Pr6Pr family membrane protein [Octadecabacter sp.]
MQTLRLFAAGLALAVAVTLIARFGMTMQEKDISALGAVWNDVRYFTIWVNTLIGVASGAIALGRVPPQWLAAGLAMAIALVAGVFHALLAGDVPRVGLDWAVNGMLHTIIPIAFIGLWFFALPKARLAWRDLLIWSAFPIIYSIYAIGRGAVDGVYPYFFLDVGNLGAGGVALWVAGLALIFIGAGAALIVCSHRFARA